MQYVLTLTSNPAAPAIDSAVVSIVEAALRDGGLTIGTIDWLDPNAAAGRELGYSESQDV